MTDPILIVGAGPTGLTAALELSRLGLPVRLVDRRAGPAATSRAVGIQARTLELMEQRGLAQAMEQLGHPTRYGSIHGGGARLLRLDFGRIRSRYPHLLLLSQVETERLLREALAARGVRPEWGTELVAFAQDPHAATPVTPAPVTGVLALPDGGLERVAASWLIAAEGAHSLVRTTLDLGFEGKTLAEQYLLGDLHLESELPGSDFHIFSGEHGFLGLFPLGGDHFRLLASHPLSGPAQGDAPSLAELQRIYDQRSHIPGRLHDLSWSSWFKINSRMVPRLRVGHLLLGGDSAHIHSPAGGQGMNTGIQDMINLAWKLALVVRGQAPPALLDSYGQDRLPVMRDVLSRSERMTRLVDADSPLVHTLFNHLAPWVGGMAFLQENAINRMAQLAIDYRHGPLAEDHAPAGTVRGGDRVPELTVRRRDRGEAGWTTARLLTLLDPSGFVLLVAHGDERAALDPRLAPALAGASVPIPIVELAPAAEDHDQAYASELGTASGVLLVRPDGYVAVAAGAHAAPAALAAFVGKWLTAGG